MPVGLSALPSFGPRLSRPRFGDVVAASVTAGHPGRRKQYWHAQEPREEPLRFSETLEGQARVTCLRTVTIPSEPPDHTVGRAGGR